MSYIDNTRRNLLSPVEMTVCMTKEECKTLLPFFRDAYKNIKRKHDRYEDIHQSGEATERQENLRMKYIDELEDLESIISEIETILK